MGEREAPFDERVEVRRHEQRIAKCVQSVRSMIVGMDVEDIRGCRAREREREQREQEGGKSWHGKVGKREGERNLRIHPHFSLHPAPAAEPNRRRPHGFTLSRLSPSGNAVSFRSRKQPPKTLSPPT